MPDADVAVNFSASVGDLVSGWPTPGGAFRPRRALRAVDAAIRGARAWFGHAFDPAPLNAYGAALSLRALEDSLAAAHAETAAAIAPATKAASEDAIRATKDVINEEIKAVEDALKQKLAVMPRTRAAASDQGTEGRASARGARRGIWRASHADAA